ncbi:universal stress protein [Streptomyces sp.]|uniref:universal stress protein n=1 Tax=Streptomyces sp. TaxID=1931 RepID=UPI00281231B0|nr:universal stress protein [Streptomyces sp.]
MSDSRTPPGPPASGAPVLVGVDGSAHGTRALEWALGAATALGAPLIVAHVRPEGVPAPGRGVSPGTGAPRPDPVLDAARALVEERGAAVPVRCTSLDGSVTDALPAAARGCRLLVTGARGRGGFASLLLGSTSRSLAATAPCPLVVVPHEARTAVPGTEAGAGRVLLGLHPEETPDEVVEFAFEAARLRGVPLEAVTVLRLPAVPAALLVAPVPVLQVPGPLPEEDDSELMLRETEREQEARLRPFAERWPEVELRPVVAPGDAAGRLVDGSRDAALLVVGRHHRHRFGSLLIGSVAHAVLHHAHCPVAVVPPVPEA